MPTMLKDKMKKLGAARRKKIENRTAQLIAQEMSLRDLRKARSLTKARIAEILKTSQDRVSRLGKKLKWRALPNQIFPLIYRMVSC